MSERIALILSTLINTLQDDLQGAVIDLVAMVEFLDAAPQSGTVGEYIEGLDSLGNAIQHVIQGHLQAALIAMSVGVEDMLEVEQIQAEVDAAFDALTAGLEFDGDDEVEGPWF